MMTLRGFGRWLLAMAIAAGSLTCSGDLAEPKPQPHPAALVGVAGDAQVGRINQMLPESLVVRAEDAAGQPLEGVAVTWTVVGGGSVSESSVLSGKDGLAAVQWGLGGTAGQQTTTAAVADLPPVVFTATAEAGAPAQLVITTQPSSAAESGVPLAQQPVIRVEDGSAQPLGAGIAVTASIGGATLAGTTTVESDGSGVARFSDLALSGSAGSYHLNFSAPGFESVQSTAITLSTTSAETGEWSQPFDWPIVPIHMILLPSGRVLAVGRTRSPQVWDPATGAFTPVPSPANLFCAGHALLSDGQVLVAGGHISDGRGLPNMTLFSDANGWTSTTPMVLGRWYATATTMGNGDVVITAGTDQDSQFVRIPEVWSNGSLRQLTGANLALPWYPRAFVAPDGSIFVAGPTATRFLTVSGSGSWRNGPPRLFNWRDYGSAVMYDDGKILYAGGGYTTNTAEVIDLNEPSPVWRSTGSMAYARRHLNATVLPTGEVLVTGGVGGTTFNDVTKGVHAAEIWNPATGQWTVLASNAITRGYHSASLLLPDGRVLSGGSGEGAGAPDERNAELFSPPYLLRGAQPVIGSAPSEVRYGEQFRIETPQASAITHVSFIRLGAVTHAFDQNQRFQRLTFTADATGLTVTAPSSSNRAPPGHYMAFILNGANVPSVAKIVRLH
jgi:galactose oxidase-like protein